MATVWSLRADQVPAIVCPTVLLDPDGETPLVCNKFFDGDSDVIRPNLNQNTVCQELGARWGGGGFAVAHGSGPSGGQGLRLTVGTGLELLAGIGQAMIDSPLTVSVSTSLPVTAPAARGYVWMTQEGALSVVNDSVTAPAVNCVFLGSFTTDTVNISDIDESGVIYFKGGSLWRRTADQDTPTDVPSAGCMLFTQGVTDLFFWDGTAHRRVWSPMQMTKTSLAAGEKVTIPAGYAVISTNLNISGGELLLNGEMKLLGN